jgi:hypothetical protein
MTCLKDATSIRAVLGREGSVRKKSQDSLKKPLAIGLPVGQSFKTGKEP